MGEWGNLTEFLFRSAACIASGRACRGRVEIVSGIASKRGSFGAIGGIAERDEDDRACCGWSVDAVVEDEQEVAVERVENPID
jgi:hypothetical protein